MSVRVKFLGRLGNNLFQYALGRIIAQHFGFELVCEQAGAWVDETLASLSNHFPNAPLHIQGESFASPIQEFDVRLDTGWEGQAIDLDAVLRDRTPRRIILAGYFQRLQYFAPFKAQIQEWFRIESPDETPLAVMRDDVLVHIRRGPDYGMRGWTLSLAYYDSVLSGLSGLGRVYVIGTGIDQTVRKHLAKYSPIYPNGSALRHFALFRHFNRIILSNSSFAWWGSYLSSAEELYVPQLPRPGAYGFTGFQSVDLHMREERYREVEGTAVAGFGVILPNKTPREVRIVEFAGSFTVLQANGPPIAIEANEPNRKLLERVLQRQEPTVLQDVDKYACWSMMTTTIRPLLKAGLIKFDGTYTDE